MPEKKSQQEKLQENAPVKFSTFGGVFTPCTLTILGVIMFLRFGQVVGNSGLWHGLLIVLMAKTVTTLTALSLSAIATNTRVRGGGAYFLISRSLGVEFGGSIGLVFYLSQAISVAMYVIGFTEALVSIAPALQEHFRVTATVINFVVFICVFIGAGWTIKVQYFILAILFIAIGSFVFGAIGAFDSAILTENLKPGYTPGNNIWMMFALFFPAATGIMAGANMSGDLANPAKSIPRGTLSSIAFTGIVYAGFAVLLCACSDRTTLINDSMIVSKKAISSNLIMAGVFAATLSSALGSLMGAPRILQALSRDQIFGFLNFFAKGSGKSDEPRRAIVLSFLIAESGIILGDLNMIAPVITMFFMITYGALNFAAFKEALSGNPSYRPTFKFSNWASSLAGAVLCIGAMLLIDWIWAVTSTIVMAGIYFYLKKQEITATWGDLHSGAALERVRNDLLQLEQEKFHPKNWRPTILAIGMHKEERLALAIWAKWLAGYHGILMLAQIITSQDADVLEKHSRAQRMLRKRLYDNYIHGFGAVTMAPSISDGISSLVQCAGIGAIRPNLALFEWKEDPDERHELMKNLRLVSKLGRSVGILRFKELPEPWKVPRGTIDVWWLGMENGSLMLLLAHLLKHNNGWRDHKIRLMRMIPDEAGKIETEKYLHDLAAEARISIENKIVIGENFKEVLLRESQFAAFCILGLGKPKEMPDDILDRLGYLTDGLSRVLLVNSTGEMSLEA